MSELAPIGVSTYTRLEHLKKTISALQLNTLAKQSHLFIFSDAPKQGDEEKVRKVREYLHTIDGFKKVIILERKVNSRIKNNRGGIKQLLDESGQCIFMEEDVVTAPGFLDFMNKALLFYKDSENILSVTGYGLPINTQKIKTDSFVLPRFNAWGFGIWKDRFEEINYIDREEYLSFFDNKVAVKNLITGGGEDMLAMLESESKGEIDALDVKAMFHQYKNNMLTVYPKNSLVQNIGHDGSGIHCGATDKFYHDFLWDKVSDFKFDDNPKVDEKISKANYNFRKLGYKTKFKVILRRIGIYPLFKILKGIIK